MPVKAGDVYTWERSFSNEDVRLFAELSGDKGIHHIREDDQGRLQVHGLLTVTIPTKIGGDLDYVAREMVLEFIRPVYTGDMIHCDFYITEAEYAEGFIKVKLEVACFNQQDKEVLRGRSHGIILNKQ
jgi:3-hydroxybutyryl-CoA dehydratase